MSIRKLSMLAVCIGFVGACWGCDDSSNDAAPASADTVCEADARQCSGNVLQECKDNAWTTLSECEHGCDADKKECKTEGEPATVCTKNECKDGNIRVVCAEDKMSVTEETCGEGEKCEDGACVPASGEGVCEAGKKECDAEKGKNAYRECSDNAWVDKTCEGDKVCSEGECVDEKPADDTCKADSKKCSEDKTGYFVCTEGKWSTEATKCGDKEVCDPAKNECVEDVPPECEKDQIKCVDDDAKSYYACVDGKWATEKTACDGDKHCDKETKSCEEKCTEGTNRCSADLKELQTCKNGVWTQKTACSAKQLCSENECKDTVCTPGVDICTGDKSKNAAMRHCKKDGQVGEMVEDNIYCDLGCTPDKTACLVCDEGALNCTDKGVFQICEKNAWVDKVSCGEGACSKDKTNAGCKCKVNTNLRCNDDKSKTEICSSFTENKLKYFGWAELQDCAGKDKCEASGTSASCKCGDKDAFSCNGNLLQLCNNGVLQDVLSCTDKEKCNAEQQKCVCNDGDRTCDGDKAKKCVGGTWVDDNCKFNETCSEKLGGVCVAKTAALCKDDDPAKCFGPAVVKCKDGLYDVAEICTVACTSDIKGARCADACVKNTQSCSSDYKSVVSCSAEQVATTEACNSDERCVEKVTGTKKSASCVKKVCEEMDSLCDGTKLSICYNNEKKAIVDCAAAGLICKNGECATK